MSKKNRQRIEELERQVAYLEAMVRHYIALYEQNKTTTAPTTSPFQGTNPTLEGGLNEHDAFFRLA